MRHELADAVARLFAGSRNAPREPDSGERAELVELAALVAHARSAVERDRVTREIEFVPGAEGPARLAITLERLLAGLDTLGCDRQLAWRVVRRVALDCIPASRRQVLAHLCSTSEEPETTKAIAESIDLPTTTVLRTLQDLTAYSLTARSGQAGKPDVWRLTEWARKSLRP